MALTLDQINDLITASKKITELPSANPLTLADVFELVQGGVNKKSNYNALVTLLSSYFQNVNGKNATNGYVGLNGYQLVLINDAGSIASYLRNVNLTSRTYLLPNKDGTIALVSDVSGIHNIKTVLTDNGTATLTQNNDQLQVVGKNGTIVSAAGKQVSIDGFPYVIATGDYPNNIVVTIEGLSALEEGIGFRMKVTQANTGAVTITVFGSDEYPFGEYDLVFIDQDGAEQALVEGDLAAGKIYIVTFDGEYRFQLVAQFGGASSGGGGGGSTEQTILATEDLTAYLPVKANGTIPDSSSVNDRNRIVGILKEDIANGFTGKYISDGLITNPSWSWTRNDKIFLNGAGLSSTPPSTGFIQLLGIATATDTINVQIHQATLL